MCWQLASGVTHAATLPEHSPYTPPHAKGAAWVRPLVRSLPEMNRALATVELSWLW